MSKIGQNKLGSFSQDALGGVLITAVPAYAASKFALGSEFYDETQGFYYRLRRPAGATTTKTWGLLSPTSSVVASITGTPATSAQLGGVNNVNIGGGALVLPLASTVPPLARFTFVNINAADLTITANGADTALAPAVVLADIGATATLYSDGVNTWTQTVNDPGAT